MSQECPGIQAWVEEEGRRVAIEARHASRYSLWVRFLGKGARRNGSEFSRLFLTVQGEEFEFGRCRLVTEPNIEGYAGRLVLIEEFNDFESLLFRRRVDRLQSPFMNLPLLLDHKRQIAPEFRDYAAGLTYDLNVYKSLFDAVDAKLEGEPAHVRAVIERGVIANEGGQFHDFMSDRYGELDRIVADFSDEDHERHGFYLRRQLWSIIMCSPFMARTNLKPRGYAGDSEMMTMIYKNEYSGDSTFAKVLNKFPLSAPAAQAVRNRRGIIAEALRSFRAEVAADRRSKPLRVLSVACGPAWEITDIIRSAADAQDIHFTMFDQDQYALMEVASRVAETERRLDIALSVDYLRESVRTVLVTRELGAKWGKYDFVYSMGLFDYLTPPVARAVLVRLYRLLEPGGRMVIGNFRVGSPGRNFIAYWLDWVIYYRSEEDFKELAQALPGAESQIEFDSTGVQMLLYVTKPAGAG
jgi:extracellular factor (EF) 3-hydroxypalmitic acid methyl ester biosynthesis protein